MEKIMLHPSYHAWVVMWYRTESEEHIAGVFFNHASAAEMRDMLRENDNSVKWVIRVVNVFDVDGKVKP